MLLGVGLGPGQLDRPAHLVADAHKEGPDLRRRGRGLGTQPRFQERAPVVEAEPGLDGGIRQKGRDHHRDGGLHGINAVKTIRS